MKTEELKNKGKKELKQMLKDLEKTAEENFIQDSKFCVFDWLCDGDREDYERIQYLLGESDYNPDEK